jgi:DNA-binding LytR/AlgR family response regulator
MSSPTAIIADDEEHLRAHLRNKLAKLWPELIITSEAANGLEAEVQIVEHHPSVAFLDIKMPGLSGLQVAQRMEGKTRFVFVTAYDEFALEAFEREAIDFLVKPVADDRLERTVKRLKTAIASASAPPDLASMLKNLLGTDSTSTRLRWLRASLADTTVHIPVNEVHYLQSDDKYTIVYTASAQHIVRMSISELSTALDPETFWQIHRSTIVNMSFVEGTRKDDNGRIYAKLRGRDTQLAVSRAWVHLFRQM